MKSTRLIILALALVVTSASVCADDLPPEYEPFKELLGKWSGIMKVTTISKKGKEELVFEHTHRCQFDKDRQAIVMINTDINRKHKAVVTSHSEIRWDKPSKRFKVMSWVPGHMARLYVVKYSKGVFHYDHVDKAEGVKFVSQVRVSDAGRLIETGKKSFPGAEGVVSTWSNTYTREE